MIVLFDLDNTLIDTQRIKQEVFYASAISFGLSEAEAKDIYQSVRNIDEKVILSPQNFAVKLSVRVGESSDVIEAKMYEKLKHLGESLCIDGAVNLLQGVQKEKLDMYIMTLGVHSWQKEKIQYAGLDMFFPKEKRILPALDLSEENAKTIALENFF